ncbi:hypothetical protein HDU85_005921 [Gaertneriomyces sp. JEL0708]|nr:hypothetical protein HDU85_005921 [Gaertneriomyces sp. JEL0708]
MDVERPYHRLIRDTQRDPLNLKRRYDAVYNTLLSEVFPCTEGFTVEPTIQYICDNIFTEPTIQYIVRLYDHPVFFLDTNDPSNLNAVYSRKVSYRRIRKTYEQIMHEYRTSICHGASAFGSVMMFCEVDRASSRISPVPTNDNKSHITDTIPLSWWDRMITDSVSIAKMEAIRDAARSVVTI